MLSCLRGKKVNEHYFFHTLSKGGHSSITANFIKKLIGFTPPNRIYLQGNINMALVPALFSNEGNKLEVPELLLLIFIF